MLQEQRSSNVTRYLYGAGMMAVQQNGTLLACQSRTISNTAQVNAGTAGQFQLSASIVVNGSSIYLPLIRK